MVSKFGNGIGIRPGFSLPELLVSIGIFVMITLAVVVNFRRSEHSNVLRFSAEELASTLRNVYTAAQTGKEISLCNPNVIEGGVERCSDAVNGNKVCAPDIRCACGCAPRSALNFGAYFTRAGITFFADGDNDLRFDPGEELSDTQFRLPADVSVSRLESPQNTDVTTADLVFSPPEPRLYIDGVETAAEVRVTLQHARTEQTRTVTIRRLSGRIEIE